jgi:hypothetical protein
VVTLARHASRPVMRRVDALMAGGISDFGVKDSFRDLDLTCRGFRPLFEANWIWRDADRPAPDAALRGVVWAPVGDAIALAEWERAWDDPGLNHPRQQFPPSLLGEPHVAFVAARRGGIIAGCIANRTGEVLGLSNTFSPAGEDPIPYWAGFVTMLTRMFPGLPVVGYERGDDLAVARAVGFAAVDPLRVWVRERSTEQ